MSDEFKATLQGVIEEQLSKASQVCDTITEYFGEELVDNNLEELKRTFLNAITDNRLVDIFPWRNRECEEDSYCYDNPNNNEESVVIPAWSEIKYKNLSEVSLDLPEWFIKRATMLYLRSGCLFNPYVIIRFPKVTVTNEYDKSVDITELYAKVTFQDDGKMRGGLVMIRTEFTVMQYLSDYAHSHLPGITNYWANPCLGTGPLERTIQLLRETFDINRWGLFCLELQKYVTVESLDGVPYRRLEAIGKSTLVKTNGDFSVRDVEIMGSGKFILASFLMYYLKNANLKIGYNGAQYTLGIPFSTFWIDISRKFCDWYNLRYSRGLEISSLDTLNEKMSLLHPYILDGDNIYQRNINRRIEDMKRRIGETLITFKGKPVRMTISDLDSYNSNTNEVYLLRLEYIEGILTRILKLINYNYGKDGEKEGTTSNKRVTIL